ncbi:primosomal protein N' (replication factor Y) - superfamily II helicase [Gemmobacter denitrificans]|uniref:Primosomal protein N' (Replication factor Y) -superfamily II helicase n=1 Tax=Gemmobacter denitrificans TaxID=3123040 RepID=A0ABU8BUV7_9RHOB
MAQVTASERHFPCEACGADLRFAPGQTRLRCDHCGHEQAIVEDAAPLKTRALGELHLHHALKDSLPPGAMEEVRTTRCPGCGSLVEFQGADHATECPFCATPVVVGTGTNRQIKPQAVLPFQLDERTARAAMVSWLGGLWFAPNGLVEYARKGRALNGLYVPYWTFDAQTDSRYTGQRGEHYYETRTVTVDGKQRQERVQKTRWYAARGRVRRFFDDVLVLASQSLPRQYTDALAPWDLGQLTPYREDYLAGFTAEGYTVGLEEGWARAQQVMAGVIHQDVRRDIGGDDQRVDSVDTDYSAETFKHILLPIWMAAYKYNGKSYRFVVNGQTGKVQGERPWSAWKIAFAIALALAAAAALAWANQKGYLG